jgi:hypothetical protein
MYFRVNQRFGLVSRKRLDDEFFRRYGKKLTERWTAQRQFH